MSAMGRAIPCAAAAWLLLGCGARAPSPPVEAKQPEGQRPSVSEVEAKPPKTSELDAEISSVRAAACLSAATESACDPALSASFRSRASASEWSSGSIWCQAGRPHVLISNGSREITGEFGQVVWEAIWRVLKATDGCASAYGGVVSTVKDGVKSACKDARFDMHALFTMAAVMAMRGPPRVLDGAARADCNKNPTACIDAGMMCPMFSGDPWNGVRAASPGAAESKAKGEYDECFVEMLDSQRRYRTQPSQGELFEGIRPFMDEARRCLPAGSPRAGARVVFQQDGTVQDVEVTEASEPAAGCIKKALSKARIPCFRGPAFGVTLPVRRRD